MESIYMHTGAQHIIYTWGHDNCIPNVLQTNMERGSYVWSGTDNWLPNYCISGNFRVIKVHVKKISRSKIFALWDFHENLTRGKNMELEVEEAGAFIAAMFIMKSGRQLLEQLHYDGRRTCQFRPEQSDYTGHMAHVSH